VIHVAEAGDDVIIKSTSRIEPDMNQTDEYARVRTYMWNPLFRRQRVLNILSDSGRPWYAGFDSLLTRTPHELGFSADTFSHDAKESFKYEENLMDENDDAMPPTRGDTEDGADESAPPPHATCEVLVYKVVGNYLSRKLKSKHELEWTRAASCRATPSSRCGVARARISLTTSPRRSAPCRRIYAKSISPCWRETFTTTPTKYAR
jgi:CRISPR-associated protein Cmx8